MAVVKRIAIILSTIILLLIILLIMFFKSCSSSYILRGWKPETEPVAFTCYSETEYGDKRIFTAWGLKSFRIEDFGYVLAVYDSKIYFTFHTHYTDDRKNDKFIFNIAAVSKDDNKNCELLYSDEFEYSDYFSYDALAEYSERGAYYYDGKIVLRDSSKLIEYDIDTDTAKSFSPDEYEFPTFEYEYSIQNDGNAVLLKNKTTGYEKLIKLEDLSSNKYGEKLLKYRESHVLGSNTLKLGNFFQNVQFVNGEVYLVGRVLNYQGESFAVVFRYDVENDKYEYVANTFVGGVFNDYFRILDNE